MLRPITSVVLLSTALLACKKADAPPPVTPSNTEVKEAPPPVAEAEAQPPPAQPRPEPPAGVTHEMVDVADRLIVAMEAMGRDLTAAGTDCVIGAAALRLHAQQLRPIALDAKKFEHVTNPAAEAWFKETYMPRMIAALGGLMELTRTCATDKDFQLASEELGKAMDM